ncbi:hypothetical protein AYM39_16015 [Methylomonas sp. DH-1]|nr:hypothetical protein AYM39_16015 [Methylomonas sp. DH-1]
MRDIGEPIQFSVFEAELNAGELQALLEKLGELIDAQLDSVSCYSLTPECQKIQLGKGPILDGLILV